MPKSTDNDSWGHATVDTTCPLDCPDSCSLTITVEKGKVVKLDGSTRHSITDGFICDKVRKFDQRLYGPDRLQYPAIRQGAKGAGTFKQINWNEALDTIAARITEIRNRSGGEAILPFSYGGSNGLLSQDTTDAELFRNIGASRLARTVCAAPTGIAANALYGKMPSVSFEDYVHSQLIVVWGANPSTTGIHLIPYIKEAQSNGAILVVIDPRSTPLSRRADLHLAVKPGTDVVLALALHRYLFANNLADTKFLSVNSRGADRLQTRAEQWTIDQAAKVAGVTSSQLEKFAELYADRNPAVIRCGWGVERNRNGGNAAMAILALPAVAGKFGVRGGGYSMSNAAALKLAPSMWLQVKEPSTRIVNMNHLGRVLLDYNDPAIEMLFVYNCNPVATMPDQNRVVRGLRREDLFTVVFDQVATDTAAFADIILPATTFLESYDLVNSYGEMSLQMSRPVIDSVGDARPNVEVFSELASRLGLDETETDAEALLRVTSTMPDDIRDNILEHGSVSSSINARPVQFVDVKPRTPDGKINLFSEQLDAEAPRGLYGYQDASENDFPLTLISPASNSTICSILGELVERVAPLEMHPDDAQARGIQKDDAVRVFNGLGEVQCPVSLTDTIRTGTVCLPKGLWNKNTFNGSTSNALVADTLTDLGGGACFNDARVEVERIVRANYEGAAVTISTSSSKIH